MAKTEKSVIEQALLEAAQIDATFKANAKEILARTMGSEIEEMVKESLGDSPKAVKEDEEDDLMATDLEMGDDEESDLDLDLGLDLGDDEFEGDDMDVIDLTDSDDEELIKVFKGMDPDSEIEVVQDENGVTFTDNETGAEYKVELGGGLDMEDELGDMDDDMDGELDLDDDEEVIDLDAGDELEYEDEDEDEEIVYEIEMTEEDDEDDDLETENITRNYPNGRSQRKRPSNFPKKLTRESSEPKINNSKIIKENKVLKNNFLSVKTENKELKESQEKMVDALKQFRQKLQEVAVFNSNLAHVVRLFTENTTTKNEKVDIVKRMDEAKTIKESSLIYKGLVKELMGVKSKKTIKESVDAKVNKTASTGASQITESKVFENPELAKMKAMWEFNYKYK